MQYKIMLFQTLIALVFAGAVFGAVFTNGTKNKEEEVTTTIETTEDVSFAGISRIPFESEISKKLEKASNEIQTVSIGVVEEVTLYEIEEVDETKYVEAVLGLKVRKEPNTESNTLGSLAYNTEVHIIGQVVDEEDWVKIEYNDAEEAYVCSAYLMDEKAVIVQKQPTQVSTSPTTGTSTQTYTPSGNVLSRSAGRINGPSGQETYYNMNMSGCISIMQSMGYNYDYWVRGDGVKMYGDYVMVAANLAIRPKGSLVQTSLGTGIVVDTGTFAYGNPTQLDIAVTW